MIKWCKKEKVALSWQAIISHDVKFVRGQMVLLLLLAWFIYSEVSSTFQFIPVTFAYFPKQLVLCLTSERVRKCCMKMSENEGCIGTLQRSRNGISTFDNMHSWNKHMIEGFFDQYCEKSLHYTATTMQPLLNEANIVSECKATHFRLLCVCMYNAASTSYWCKCLWM